MFTIRVCIFNQNEGSCVTILTNHFYTHDDRREVIIFQCCDLRNAESNCESDVGLFWFFDTRMRSLIGIKKLMFPLSTSQIKTRNKSLVDIKLSYISQLVRAL